MLDHSFFVGSIFEQMGHLNSGVIVGILVLFFCRGCCSRWGWCRGLHRGLVTLCNVSSDPTSTTIAHVTWCYKTREWLMIIHLNLKSHPCGVHNCKEMSIFIYEYRKLEILISVLMPESSPMTFLTIIFLSLDKCATSFRAGKSQTVPSKLILYSWVWSCVARW